MSASLPDTTLVLNSAATLPTANFPIAYINWIILINVSPYACRVSFGGYSFVLPAWYSYPVPLRDDRGNLRSGVSTPFTVTPYLQTIPGVGFTSVLHTLLFMVGEEPPQTAPTPLGGGPIDLTVATSVISTTLPAGNTVLFAEPLGDTSAGGAVQIGNNGIITLGDASYAAEILAQDTNLANQSQIRGGQITILGTNAANGAALDISASTAPTAIKLPTGSLTRIITVGQTSIAQAGTSVAHTLGAIPDFVLPIHDAGSNSADVITINFGTMTSTHFTAYSTNAAGTGNIRFILFKF